MKVSWAEPALKRLRSIGEYVEANDPAAAARLIERIETAVERLGQFPYLGRPGHEPGTRELSIAGTRYIAVYTISAERVEILAVFHERQSRPTAFLRDF